MLFTSRDYIYRSARQNLKESALPVIKESQVVIQVEQLTKEEREQILYNHIRQGSQPKKIKGQLKPLLPGVAVHEQFSPEIARRLGNQMFTARLDISEVSLANFVAHPLELLCEIIQTLDAGSRSSLALVFMSDGVLPSPVKMTGDEEQAVTLLGGSTSDVRSALNALNGSLLLHTMQGGTYSWRFKHPTIRDAFAAVVAHDRELMDIYLKGTPVKKLFQEVSCGDVGIKGVKVVVPIDRYDALIIRLSSFDTKKDENKRALHMFLAHRCDREFLANYIRCHPQFIQRLLVYSYLDAVSDVSVIGCLHKYGVLPEEKRVSTVNSLRDLAVSTPDSGFLHPRICELLKPNELADILEDVRIQLLPNLDSEIQHEQDNYDYESDPESHFDSLVSTLNDYREAFSDDPKALAQIESALSKIENVVEGLWPEQQQEPDSDDSYGRSSKGGGHDESRSVFDDVDQ